MARVTAIVLTYDRLHLLRRALASVRWQTHGDLEILVVANGASAETRSWLATQTDPRIRVLDLPENISAPLARNRAMQEATGDWFAHLDDDDLWAPDKVESMLAEAQLHQRRWVYCGVVYVDPAGDVLGGKPLEPVTQAMARLPVAYTVPGGLSGVMWHREAMPDGGMMEDLPYTGDWDIALRLSAAGPPAHVDRPLVGYRQHPGSWSRSVDDDRHQFEHVLAKHAHRRSGRRAHWGEHYRYVAAHAARAGDRPEAIRLYLRAIAAFDLISIPRLLGTLLPVPGQRLLRRWLLSDRRWMADGQVWLDALHQMP